MHDLVKSADTVARTTAWTAGSRPRAGSDHVDVLAPDSGALPAVPAAAPLRIEAEPFPFTVRCVRNEEQLGKAIRIRRDAYARHVPQVARGFNEPEVFDKTKGSVVLLAESKLDGGPVGTLRIQTNHYQPLAVENVVELPDFMQRRSLAEITRLGVIEGRQGRLVTHALFKALYLYCLALQIHWMVVAARSPLDRSYLRLAFHDLYPEREYFPLPYAGNIPHKVLAFEVMSAERRWKQVSHPLYEFMVESAHPDINVFASVSGAWATPRRGR